MVSIAVGNYQVEIFNYPFSNYSAEDSEDKYDWLHFDNNEHQFSTIIGIKTFHADQLLKSALIGAGGAGMTVHKTSFISESDRLLICCSDTVYCISLPDLSFIWRTKTDEAACFEIFKWKSDYIVHGELEITRLGYNGQIIWRRSGADIFTTLDSNADSFLVTENYILATDWNNSKYKFDFNGNIIP